MDLDVDPAKVLYVVGVLFGVAAVLYFARDIVFELSITVRALLLLLAFVVLLVAALSAEDDLLVPVFSVLSAAAYLAFLAYALSRFDVGADGTFFALLVSAGLFLALAYLVRERDVSPSRRTAQYAVVATLLVGVAAVGADVAASEVDYEVDVANEGAVDDSGRVVLGTLTVHNRFVFREPIDLPQSFACVAVPGVAEHDVRPTPVAYRIDGERGVPDSVPGGAALEVTMTVRLTPDEVAALDGPIPVERAEECPTESADPRIVVIVGGEMTRPPLR